MNRTKKILNGLVGIALAFFIASCGSGDSLTGGGESGLGGTGIGLVKGNIAAVETALMNKGESETDSVWLASFKLFIDEAYAQTGSLAGITVTGGGQITSTNINGEFILFDVIESENMLLNFKLPFGQMFELEIGRVLAGEAVLIRNIRLNEATGGATFDFVETLPFNGDVSDFVLSSPPVSAEQVIQEYEEALEEERRREEERQAQEDEEAEEMVEDDPAEEDPVDDTDPTCPPGEDCDGDGVPDDL